MPKAIWNDAVLAQSDTFETVEGNIYFPRESIDCEYFRESATHTTCPWKGVASYFDIVVDGKVNADAAWYYPEPKPAAQNIAGHVAFWRGVTEQKRAALVCAQAHSPAPLYYSWSRVRTSLRRARLFTTVGT